LVVGLEVLEGIGGWCGGARGDKWVLESASGCWWLNWWCKRLVWWC
jgi:hypothetical protein